MSIHCIYNHSTYSHDCAYQPDILILGVEEVLRWIPLLGSKLPVRRYRG